MIARLAELDRWVFMALFGGTTPGYVLYAMLALTIVGRGYILWALATLAFLPRSATRVLPPSLFTLERQRLARELLAVLVAVAVTVYAAKAFFQRRRPYLQFDLIPLGATPRDFSFPSGHAAGAFAFATFLVTRLELRRSSRVALLALAAAISVSRVYLGAHFPSDVLAGSVLGALGGGLTGRWLRRKSAPLAKVGAGGA